jgi:hypothetical protein
MGAERDCEMRFWSTWLARHSWTLNDELNRQFSDIWQDVSQHQNVGVNEEWNGREPESGSGWLVIPFRLPDLGSGWLVIPFLLPDLGSEWMVIPFRLPDFGSEWMVIPFRLPDFGSEWMVIPFRLTDLWNME